LIQYLHYSNLRSCPGVCHKEKSQVFRILITRYWAWRKHKYENPPACVHHWGHCSHCKHPL